MRYITAATDQIAPYILLPGDPLRAKYMAQKFLTNVQLVSQAYSNFVFTGTYRSIPITIAASGMGVTSLLCYTAELINHYNVKAIIRVGTAGAYDASLHVNDLILVKQAYSDFVFWPQVVNQSFVEANAQLNQIITQTAQRLPKLVQLQPTLAHTTVFFYNSNPAQVRQASLAKGIKVVEMEAYALFVLGIKLQCATACLLSVSNLLFQPADSRVIDTNAEQRVVNFSNMFLLGLESLRSFHQQTIGV